MKGFFKIAFLVVIRLAVANGANAVLPVDEKVILITDRVSCVAGDTVWFTTTILHSAPAQQNNIVHVQLDGTENRHIAQSIIRSDGANGQGFLVIPDSLSTGTYIVKAFVNTQKNRGQEIASRLLVVYNRFDNSFGSLPSPVNFKNGLYNQTATGLELSSDKTIYKTRENARVQFSVPDLIRPKVANIILRVMMVDPVSADIPGDLFFVSPQKTNEGYTGAEKDGIVVTGQVFDEVAGNPVSGATVMLSVPDSVPYFDYYYTGNDGRFSFFMKDLTGTAELVMQVAPQKDRRFRIVVDENYVETSDPFVTRQLELKPEQAEYAKKLADMARYRKLFYPGSMKIDRQFSKPFVFNYPFYGKPSNTVFPADYIDLPSFREIARELLSGARYRERKDTIFVKVMNEDRGIYFPGEPLKLLDGIPVFDAKIFSEKNSTDISRIDLITEERFFGDMQFSGVIAIYSPKPDLDWIKGKQGILRTYVRAIQPAVENTGPVISFAGDKHLPDFRQVLFWKRIVDTRESLAEFRLSDLKGDAVITLTVVTTDGQVFNANRRITIK